MFVNNINPVLLNIGPLEIRYYGIIYALGFIIAYLFLNYFIKKDMIKGLGKEDNNKLDNLILYLLIGVVAGARIFTFVFYNPSVFWTDPLEILKIWHGGLSFHGGLIGSIIAIYIYSRKYKIKVISLMDALVVPASLALALGRIANFTNSELYGFPSNLPWCVKFLSIDNICRHPYQLYASLSHFIMFGIVLFIFFKQKKESTSFWSFITIYGLFRFVTDFFRVEPKIWLGILGTGQLLSLTMFVIGLYIIIKNKLVVLDSRSKNKTKH